MQPKPPAMPECEKLKAIQERSQSIGEFLEWLCSTKGVSLMVDMDADPDDINGTVQVPMRESKEELLAEFFEIDLDKVEDEKRALLDFIRQQESLQTQNGD